MLAFAVGFGDSMLWFGGSAGVAITNLFPEAKNAVAWLKGGWHVAVACVVGFMAMLALLVRRPDPPHKKAELDIERPALTQAGDTSVVAREA